MAGYLYDMNSEGKVTVPRSHFSNSRPPEIGDLSSLTVAVKETVSQVSDMSIVATYWMITARIREFAAGLVGRVVSCVISRDYHQSRDTQG